MTPWLAVIGIGPDGPAGLSAAARDLIGRAELLVGGARHLAQVDSRAERMAWTRPLQATIAAITARRGQRIVVLASGDPMWFGAGATLSRHVARAEMIVLPHPGAFSLAAARLAWSLADVETLTLHGRPLASLAAHLAPGVRLLVLSEDGATPAAVARDLVARGWGPSMLHALENLDGPEERIVAASAEAWTHARCAELNTLAIECRPATGTRALSRAPGLPDEAYRHDGQITKREVRAATLARLSPLTGQLLWDVGAGSGAIAIEWLRAARDARACAIERDPGRATMIADNAAALGVPRLAIVAGEAPAAFDGLEAPDAVFIGGGLSQPELVALAHARLAPGGRIVANAVTVEGETALAAAADRFGGDLVRIAVSRAEPIGPYRGWRPLMPVTQWAAIKA